MNFEWYAVTVKPQHERSVEQGLFAKGYEAYLPLYLAVRKWSDRTKKIEMPLFPGYVFCRFDPQQITPIVRTPGVNSVVSFGGIPAAIPETEVTNVQRMLESGLPVEPWPFLKVGQRIRIAKGPLVGVEGMLIDGEESARLVVNIDLFQRACSVRVERDSIIALAG